MTSIEPQRKKGRVNVHVGGHFAFSLSDMIAMRAGLRCGQIITQSDADRLIDEDAAQVAQDTALTYLSRRARSERELRRNLVRKNIPDTLIDKVLARLRDMNLLDDAAFARFWVGERDHFSPRSGFALRSELMAKGVSRELAEEAIAQGADEENRARAIAERRFKRLRGLDEDLLRKRLIDVVVRRGFSYELARRVTRDMVDEPIDAAGEGADIDWPA